MRALRMSRWAQISAVSTRYSASSATTSLVAGSINTTRSFTTMYLYERMAGTSTATSCGIE